MIVSGRNILLMDVDFLSQPLDVSTNQPKPEHHSEPEPGPSTNQPKPEYHSEPEPGPSTNQPKPEYHFKPESGPSSTGHHSDRETDPQGLSKVGSAHQPEPEPEPRL